MRRALCLLVLLVLILKGQALVCESCHDKCSCLQPKEEVCKHNARCFESRDSHGNVIRKGCTKNCLDISKSCKQCSWNYCNRDFQRSYYYDKECYEFGQKSGRKTKIGLFVSVVLLVLSIGV